MIYCYIIVFLWIYSEGNFIWFILFFLYEVRLFWVMSLSFLELLSNLLLFFSFAYVGSEGILVVVFKFFVVVFLMLYIKNYRWFIFFVVGICRKHSLFVLVAWCFIGQVVYQGLEYLRRFVSLSVFYANTVYYFYGTIEG